MGSRKLSEDVIFAVKKVKLKSREQTIPGRGNIMWKVLRLERRPVSWNISGARGTGLRGQGRSSSHRPQKSWLQLELTGQLWSSCSQFLDFWDFVKGIY